MSPEKQYFLNGKDLWVIFGVALLKQSTDDFLKFPDAKEPITHDWRDSNGEDADLSRVFYKPKDITIECIIKGTSEADWWAKYDRFFAELTLPGLKRFEISEFQRSFYVYYKSCSQLTRFTRIQGTNQIISKFSITIREQEPKYDNSNVFLVDHDGRFVVT